ncbi:MAG: hypothetical protein E3J72_12685 [Planctomycetota bacterium]|nr:MAG: hypothetical protein E3J72_12685 [Planctomycetota bacterium]
MSIKILLPAYGPGLAAGHDKFDIEYVLDRKPDIIMATMPMRYIRDKDEIERMIKNRDEIGRELLKNRRLFEEYEPVDCRRSWKWRAIFRRKDTDRIHVDRISEVEKRLF